jgi:outer membrane protein
MYMNMQRRHLTIAAVFLLMLHYSATAQNQSPDSLITQISNGPAVIYTPQQCVDSAIKNNFGVKGFDFTAQLAKTARLQQFGNMLPTLNGYGSFQNIGGKSVDYTTYQYVNQNYNQGYYQLQGQWILWNGGSLVNFLKQYSLAYEADKKDWQYQKDQITVTVILDYLQVLSAEDQLALAQAQAADTRHRVDLMRIQDSLGAIAPSDFSDAKGLLNTAEVTIVQTKNQLETAKLALAQAMNIPYSPNMDVVKLSIDPTPTMYNASVDQVYQNATTHLAAVDAVNLHLEAAIKGVKAWRGNMTPTLSLFYQVYTNYASTSTASTPLGTAYVLDNGAYTLYNGSQLPIYSEQQNYSPSKPVSFGTQFQQNVYKTVGLQINIPILNRLSYRVQYQSSKILLAQAQFNQKTTMNQLRQAVESNYVQMVQALRLYNTYFKQVQNYEESFRQAQIKYDAGALASLLFVTYNTNKNQAELNLINAKYSYLLQTKILDYFQGQLTW